MPEDDLVEAALRRSVVGAFYEVDNPLGYGFLEHIYSLALERELVARRLHVDLEVLVRRPIPQDPARTG